MHPRWQFRGGVVTWFGVDFYKDTSVNIVYKFILHTMTGSKNNHFLGTFHGGFGSPSFTFAFRCSLNFAN